MSEKPFSVFLTYSDTGKLFAEGLAQHLVSKNISVIHYLHNGLPDEEYQEVQAQIEKASCVVAVISPYIGYAFPNSHPLDIARQLAKPTLPILFTPDPARPVAPTKPPVPFHVIYSRDNAESKDHPYLKGLPYLQVRYTDDDLFKDSLHALEQLITQSDLRWFVFPLLHTLENAPANERQAAANKLGTIEGVFSSFAEGVFHSYNAVRANNARRLALAFPASLPVILDMLRTPSRLFLIWPVPARHESLGYILVNALQEVNPPRLHEILWEHVRGNHPDRSQAAKYILLRLRFNMLHFPEDEFIYLYDPNDTQEAMKQINWLMKNLDQELLDIPVLLDLFSDPSSRSSLYAVMALCGIGDPRTLINLMHANYFFYNTETIAYRNFAMRHLSDESIVPDLIKLINDDSFRHYEFLGILNHIGTPEALQAVKDWFSKQPPKKAINVLKDLSGFLDGKWGFLKYP